jgi:hypothetical protein
MKITKVLTIALLLGFSNLSLVAQDTLIHSSMYVNHLQSYSTLYFSPFWNMEQIVLDSATQTGKHYTATVVDMDSILIIDTFKTMSAPMFSNYTLREKDEKVYFSGYLRKVQTTSSGIYTDSFRVDNILLYDYTMNPGDSFHVNIPYLELDFYFRLDSIVPIMYGDSIVRESFYMSHSKVFNHKNQSIWIKGMGSNMGLSYLPASYYQLGVLYADLLSLCSNSQLVYLNNLFEKSQFNNYCTSEGLNEIMDYFRKNTSTMEINSNKSGILLFPNPAGNEFFIQYPSDFTNETTLQLMDVQGRVVFQSPNQVNSIKTENLPSGIYFLQIQNLNKYQHETHKIIISK